MSQKVPPRVGGSCSEGRGAGGGGAAGGWFLLGWAHVPTGVASSRGQPWQLRSESLKPGQLLGLGGKVVVASKPLCLITCIPL